MFNKMIKKVLMSYDEKELLKNLEKACKYAEDSFSIGESSEELFCIRYRRIREAKRHAEKRIYCHQVHEAGVIFA